MNIGPKAKTILDSISAWESGACSDAQLNIAIEALELTLATLRACGANWVATMGLQTTLTSMASARDSRERDRKQSLTRV